jgi:hypothetical protein
MSQQAIFEYQVLEYAFSSASKAASLELDTGSLEESLPVNFAAELNQQLVDVLEDISFTAVVARIPNQQPPVPSPSYALRLRAKYKDGQLNSMTFYRIKDSWQSTALSLVSIAIALAAQSHTGVILPSASILLNSWKQFVALSRPKDDLEIDTYEALVRAMAKLAMKTLSARQPSAAEIFTARAESVVLSMISDVVDGLKRLKELSLIEIAAWGGHGGDYSHPENRWQPRI